MSGFFKIPDFFLKSVLRKTAEFSVSDTGDPLILTCLNVCKNYHVSLSNKEKNAFDITLVCEIDKKQIYQYCS